MKRFKRRLLTFGCLILAVSQVLSAQTVPASEDPNAREDPLAIGSSCWAVADLHADTAFVVGDQATVRRTTDWGESWTLQQDVDGRATTLLGVEVLDSSTICAVGQHGTFLRSDDAGGHWTRMVLDSTQTLYALSFTSLLRGTAVGDHGLIYGTTDGGASWVKQDSAKVYPLLGVSFSDSLTGTAVGGNGTILRTTNGGISWSAQTSGVTNYLYGVTFVSPLVGTAVGTVGTVLHTTDGGATWAKQTTNTAGYFYAVSFHDSATGMAVGSGGLISGTSDGGATWVQKTGLTTVNLYGVTFHDTARWIAVGGFGTIIRKRDTSLVVTRVADPSVGIPMAFELEQNYPNPFNPSTTIEFTLSMRAAVRLALYDILGRPVGVLIDDVMEEGIHRAVWDGSGYAGGVYYCRLEIAGPAGAGKISQIRKMLLVK